MSATIGNISNSAVVALVAATAKTVIQLRAPANRRVKILSYKITFDGTNVTATPVIVKLRRQTNGGTMTALTPAQKVPVAETIQCTAGENATVEPTGPTTIDESHVHPQAGYEKIFPYGQEPVIAGSGFVGLEITAPSGVNVLASIDFDE